MPGLKGWVCNAGTSAGLSLLWSLNSQVSLHSKAGEATVKLRINLAKPVTEHTPETPKPAWV